MRLPKQCVVDTNVPKTANLATSPTFSSDVPTHCVQACIEAIEHVIKTRGLIIDAAGEIFEEYRHQLQLRGQPGVGDGFMKWVHDVQYGLPARQRVAISPRGETYAEFPDHKSLADFDKADRKFVAVANAHPDKPPVLQATDSKWWGWREALQEVGIRVHFLCPDYVKAKYGEKASLRKPSSPS